MQRGIVFLLLAFVGSAETAMDFSWLTAVTKPKTTILTCSETKIVGGEVAARGRWPFMALLTLGDDSPFCGASILNENWILTAAHCVEDLQQEDIDTVLVIVGEYDTNKKEGSEQRFHVALVVRHESYDPNAVKNDIALIKIKGTIKYTPFAKPICLPPAGVDFSGQTCIVIGWGRTSEGGDVSNVPMQVALPILTADKCRKKFPEDRINPNTQICGGAAGKGKDSCQGDSGGPFVCTYKGTNYVAGIVSYGYGCTEGGVYTKVFGFDTWIRNTVAKH